MRGKVRFPPDVSRLSGITPAYAGKRDVRYIGCKCKWDHPRLCGEKKCFLHQICRWSGSPPPMRGKAEAFAVADLFVGITPAYAGKRQRHSVPRPCGQDHPRLCGEKCTHLSKKRGVVRITPAYAGKSCRNADR